MTGIYEFEGWAARIIRAYHEPPINAFRALALGLDGTNAVPLKVTDTGVLIATVGGGGAAAQVEGIVADGTDLSGTPVNPVLVGGRAATDNHLHAASIHHTSAGVKPWVVLLIDAGDHTLDIKSSGEVYGLVGSTDDTKTNAHYLKTLADGTLVPTISSLPSITGIVTTIVSSLPSIVGTVTANVAVLPISEAVTPAAFSVGAANATSGYHTVLATATWRWLKFVSTMDTDFAVSFDASTQHKTIPAGVGEVIDLYSDGLKISAGISYKYLTAPTRGNFYVEGLSA